MTHIKNICQKLAVAAASSAIGFAALETLPAKAASFALGNSTTPLFIEFSGNVTLEQVNQASMGFDQLDSFQATFRYILSPTSYEEATWDKNDLSSFSFYFNPLTIDAPQSPSGPDRSSLRLQAKNSRGATLSVRPESAGFVMAYLPIECPPGIPAWIKECGYSSQFRVGRGAVYRTADDSTPAPVPEGTVIPGLALGIGWLIKKRKHMAVK
jgi:hypothetical protein